MIKIPLVWRMILPTLLLSLLLFSLGLGAAGYVYVWNSRVSENLDAKLSAVLAIEELVLGIRDVRNELERFAKTDDQNYWREALRASQDLQRILMSSQYKTAATSNYAVLRQRLLATNEIIANLKGHDSLQAETIVSELTAGSLADAESLLDSSRVAVAGASDENRRLAGRIGVGLALLGISGAAAGLLVGLGVARGVARSMEQLSGSLYSAAESLAAPGAASANRSRELPEILAAASDVRELALGMASELERSRENAARADQLSAVGQLAAGIAHELRNPLTAIKLLVDTSKERDEGLHGQHLNVVQEEVNRMAQMLQTFLDFARPPRLVRENLLLCTITQQAIELVRLRATRLGIVINYYQETSVEVSADRQQIRQVLLNLLLNAIDAQPDGGKVDVRLSLHTLESFPDSDTDGSKCIIEISDLGAGIDDKISDRLFEPFVSTKETGIGLGLAISQRIVTSHDGRLTVSENRPHGAIFRLELPMVQPIYLPPTDL